VAREAIVRVGLQPAGAPARGEATWLFQATVCRAPARVHSGREAEPSVCAPLAKHLGRAANEFVERSAIAAG